MTRRSSYFKIQEFVRRARKRARLQGCQKCRKLKEVGLRGTPRLSELSRGGATLIEIKDAMRSRGWYCRKCVGRMDGTTAAATLRDQFPPTPEGKREYYRHCFNTERPKFVEMGWNVVWFEDGSYGPVLPPEGELVNRA